MKMYFIAVVLPPHLNTEILKYKKWAQEQWNCKVGLKSPAHITLIPPFWMDEAQEASLVADINALSSSQQPFEVVTANFSCFRPRTLFVAVAPNAALDKLKVETDRYFKMRPQYGAKIDTRPFHPHITIATRDLRKSAFAEAWPQLEHQSFVQTFTTNGLTLLRHNGQVWDEAYTAPFHT